MSLRLCLAKRLLIHHDQLRLNDRCGLRSAAVYLLGTSVLKESLEEHGLIVLVEGLVGP